MPDASSGSAPADEFDRELRELIEGRAGEAMFTEPSAAERAKGAVARARPAVRARAGPGRRRRGPVAGTLLLAGVVAGAAVLGWLGYRHIANEAGNAAGAAGAAAGLAPAVVVAGPPVEPVLSGTIIPMDPLAGTPTDPFAGTLAGHWADGAAGIVVPPARPVGGFSRAQVAAAYEMTRKLLIAANLDRQTLLGGPPTAFAKLLPVAQRATFLAGLDKPGVTKAGNSVSTRTWVASFAPGSTELIGSVIKVTGTMSARAVGGQGTAFLAVDVSYYFAYAVEPPHDPSDWTRVIDHEHGSIDFAPRGDHGGALQPWDRAVIDNGGMQYGTDDGYIYPAYPSDFWIVDRGYGPLIPARAGPGRPTAVDYSFGYPTKITRPGR